MKQEFSSVFFEKDQHLADSRTSFIKTKNAAATWFAEENFLHYFLPFLFYRLFFFTYFFMPGLLINFLK